MGSLDAAKEVKNGSPGLHPAFKGPRARPYMLFFMLKAAYSITSKSSMQWLTRALSSTPSFTHQALLSVLVRFCLHLSCSKWPFLAVVLVNSAPQLGQDALVAWPDFSL
jgi:hypothetical protein